MTFLLSILLLLTWTYPWGANPAYSVVIQRRDSAGVYTTDLAVLVGPVTSYADGTVTAGVVYCYHMAAQDQDGTRRAFGPETCMTAGASPLVLAIIWPTGDPRYWVIERREGTAPYAVIATTDANPNTPTSFTDLATIPGHSYTYRLKGRNMIGDGGYSNEATGTEPLPTVPNAASNTTLTLVLKGSVVTLPQDLTATVMDANNIRLNWTAPTDPAAVWAIVQVSINGGAFQLVQDSKTLASAGQYFYSTALKGTYKFRLRIWDQATKVPFGFSNESNSVTV